MFNNAPLYKQHRTGHRVLRRSADARRWIDGGHIEQFAARATARRARQPVADRNKTATGTGRGHANPVGCEHIGTVERIARSALQSLIGQPGVVRPPDRPLPVAAEGHQIGAARKVDGIAAAVGGGAAAIAHHTGIRQRGRAASLPNRRTINCAILSNHPFKSIQFHLPHEKSRSVRSAFIP